MNRTVEQTQKLIESVRSRFPDAVDLATTISLAVRVEPELLRIMRLRLLPDVNVGAEADLWFSPLMQVENPLACELFPDVKAQLRQNLAQDQARLQQAWDVLEEVHQELPPIMRLEEQITWLALSGMPGAYRQIEDLFQQVLTSMVTEKRLGLAHWAIRALPQLPDNVRTTHSAHIMALGASGRLGGRSILADEIPADLNSPLLHWVMSTDVPTTTVGIRLLANGVVFGDQTLPNAHLIEIPATNPLLVEVNSLENPSSPPNQVIWFRGETRAIKINPEAITIQTTNGKIYALNPVITKSNPSSKESIPELFIQQEHKVQIKSVDIAIITVREDEFEAVLSQLEEYQLEPLNGPSRRTYAIFSVPTRANKACTVALARCPEQGADVAQQVASDIIRDLDPQLLLVVGIAGGVPHNEFTLGDVIISSRIHNFNVNAAKQGDITFDVKGGIHPFVSNITANLPMYKSRLVGWNKRDSIGIARPSVDLKWVRANVYGDTRWRNDVLKSLTSHFGESASQVRLPMFKTGSIASSNSLMQDTQIPTTWLESARSILAVEMESAGVLQAAQQMHKQYPVMAIRGISDIIGLNRDQRWTSYACQSAGAFTCAFIKAGIVEPQDSSTTTAHPPDQPNISNSTSATGTQDSNKPAPLDVFISHSADDEKFKKEALTDIRDNRQSKILEKIFKEPIPQDLTNADIESLMQELAKEYGGNFSLGPNGRILVALNGVRGVFPQSDPQKPITGATLRAIREYLQKAGVGPGRTITDDHTERTREQTEKRETRTSSSRRQAAKADNSREREKLLVYKQIFQAMHEQMAPKNLYAIDNRDITVFKKNLTDFSKQLRNLRNSTNAEKYVLSLDAIDEKIDNVIIELNVALDLFDRLNVEKIDIANYTNGREAIYQRLSNCRKSLEEVLRLFLI